MQIVKIKETPSTNNYLRELLKTEKPEEGSIIITGIQTAGRGQAGNFWESEPGKNLTFSIIIYPHHIQPNEQFVISQTTALAIKNVLNTYTAGISIKWPNDIYYSDKKIAGILIENSLSENIIEYSIIGIGLNINQEIFTGNAPNPVSLKQITGREFDLDELLEKIQFEFLSIYKKIPSEKIRKNYLESLYRKKGFYLFKDQQEEFQAEIVTIEPSGLLVLKTKNGSYRKYSFKEVSFS